MVLTAANLTVGAPLVSGTPVTFTAPVAYTLGGWTMRSSNLKVAINANEIASAERQGSLQLPMVNEELKLKIDWTPQLGTSGAKWTLGGVSGAEVKFPLYNLIFTPDGNVTLNGQPWASATGLTNFSLFDCPFPAAEVGVARQGTDKDPQIVFEKLQIKGEVKTVSFDLGVSAKVQDENTLGFIGEGDLSIARKLNVGVKAGQSGRGGPSVLPTPAVPCCASLCRASDSRTRLYSAPQRPGMHQDCCLRFAAALLSGARPAQSGLRRRDRHLQQECGQ